ncbi:MAG: YcxB family protein [Oscillibacter sp.]|nr:YcxB family protein [Oscillibacter sp.]MBQ2996434.1 YcxB family protein [Oscillibacter sp.]
MNRIHVSYPLSVSDFRRASYYGLALRNHKMIRPILLMVGFAATAAVSTALWGWDGGAKLAAALGVVCAIWLLTLFAGEERNIRRYIKQPDTMIGCEYHMTLESHRIEIRVPERNVNYSVKINDLAAVFELSGQFLIYTSVQDAYILPFRVLSKEQIDELKETFRRHLGDRFTENKGLSRKKKKA